METIAQTIKMARESLPVSSPTPSKFHLSGKSINWSKQELERFWKTQLIESMKEIEPRFIVDHRNEKLLSAIYGWVWGLNSVLDHSRGLLFWGPIGVGKSVLLRGLQVYESRINRIRFGCSNNKLGFKFTSAAEIALLYAEKGMEGISKFTDRERMCNLAIDEIGREATDSKHFGTGINVVQTILQLRYEHRREFITHGTTNLDPNTQFSDTYGDYIADRVKELFNVIEIKGDTRR